MMWLTNVRMAAQSIRSARWRSFLTMLGVIIGVGSVVTIVSIGEGVKREVVGQINRFGPDLITVRPGRAVERDADGNVSKVNFSQSFMSGATLSQVDITAVKRTSGVGLAVPLGAVSGAPSVDGREFGNTFIVGTTQDLPKALNQKVEFGGFFTADEMDRNVAVIGRNVALEVFGENAPIGRAMTIRGQTFVVRGVFERFDTSPLSIAADYNMAVFIPQNAALRFDGQPLGVQQVLAKPLHNVSSATVARSINDSLKQAHGGQDDFTVLSQEDNLAVAGKIVGLLTGLISAIAAISLVVGGIGIMNIMLVAVSERTQEIGIRKAIGATNGQILGQFVTEAVMISAVGGVIGILMSFLANYFLRVFTSLRPVVSWEIMAVALGVGLFVGIFFGSAPALKAARKDPIDALRQY